MTDSIDCVVETPDGEQIIVDELLGHWLLENDWRLDSRGVIVPDNAVDIEAVPATDPHGSPNRFSYAEVLAMYQ